jgi:hypothetical protein
MHAQLARSDPISPAHPQPQPWHSIVLHSSVRHAAAVSPIISTFRPVQMAADGRWLRFSPLRSRSYAARNSYQQLYSRTRSTSTVVDVVHPVYSY